MARATFDKRATLDKRPGDVARMFDAVADRYDRMNALMTFGQERRWRRQVAAAVGPAPGMRVLDLAAGTGASSLPFAAAGAHPVACDFSAGMLRSDGVRHPQLTFVAGDALALPFADDSFDAATISFGLRNVAVSHTALVELLRVTARAGGSSSSRRRNRRPGCCEREPALRDPGHAAARPGLLPTPRPTPTSPSRPMPGWTSSRSPTRCARPAGPGRMARPDVRGGRDALRCAGSDAPAARLLEVLVKPFTISRGRHRSAGAR